MRKDLRSPKTMKQSFSIGSTNDVSLAEASTNAGKISFSSERELQLRTAGWPGSRLVEVWNKLPEINRVAKFTYRRTAIHRIWRAIHEGKVNQTRDPSTQNIASTEAVRPNTKTDLIISLLKQSAGATLRSIMELTGWQAHSVRGFLSAQVSKKRGLRVQSFTRDGERVYRIRT